MGIRQLFGVRKHPRTVKPEQRSYEFDVYFVRAGELGADEYGRPGLSEFGALQAFDLAKSIKAAHSDTTIEVLEAYDPRIFSGRQTLMAGLIANDLGTEAKRFPWHELSLFNMAHGWDDKHLFLDRLRACAETNGTNVFIVVAMQPTIESIFAGRYIGEGTAHHLSIVSKDMFHSSVTIV